ncbi:hypothetical protein AYO47_00610 [Planctomyces sp. SCGC AG-212-M04]|nr:hypothetical protein AYO47_00610 [Planctomyces sp. SCGC AG-212-M04]
MRSIRHLPIACLVFMFGLTAAGCSQGRPASETVPAAPDAVGFGSDAKAASDVKKWLEAIGQSGEGGSGLEGLPEAIEKLEIDAGKKAALKKDLDVLMKTNDKAKIKATATKMAGQL